eukprot:1063393-Amorphochlora_amoeboformis.AAC.1
MSSFVSSTIRTRMSVMPKYITRSIERHFGGNREIVRGQSRDSLGAIERQFQVNRETVWGRFESEGRRNHRLVEALKAWKGISLGVTLTGEFCE